MAETIKFGVFGLGRGSSFFQSIKTHGGEIVAVCDQSETKLATTKEKLGEDAYAQEVAGAKKVAEALTNAGYDLACYTYANLGYGGRALAVIQNDLSSWEAEVTPILGQLDTFVFAQNSDISTESTYSGQKFQALQEAGFRRYLGFSTNGAPWATLQEDYMRMGRIMVGGENVRNHPDWFEGIFDCTDLLNR